jgi:hypothetical protein
MEKPTRPTLISLGLVVLWAATNWSIAAILDETNAPKYFWAPLVFINGCSIALHALQWYTQGTLVPKDREQLNFSLATPSVWLVSVYLTIMLLPATFLDWAMRGSYFFYGLIIPVVFGAFILVGWGFGKALVEGRYRKDKKPA